MNGLVNFRMLGCNYGWGVLDFLTPKDLPKCN